MRRKRENKPILPAGAVAGNFYCLLLHKEEAKQNMRLTQNEKIYFSECVSDLMDSDQVRRMNRFIQHADVSCLEHCISVARTSLWLSRLLGISVDRRSMIRGALLHDFFLYDWHEKSDRKGLHGFTHPRTALENAQREFVLNDREKDIILRHMWPLTPVPPRYREGFIVSFSDKYCSVLETLRFYKSGRTLD
ncbi:HD domain-containing protein [Caproicibacter fermentans]|nr:HD domain-containing protein [Caproicibacter fermentans]